MDSTPIFGLGIPSEDGSDAADLAALLRTLGLDVENKAGGITAMTNAARVALTGDGKYEGRVVYETDTDTLWISDGTNWKQITLGTLGLWSAYTPTWTGGSPSIGNGELKGRWCRIGNTVHARVSLLIGSTTDKGSGGWAFSLPVARTPEVGVPTGAAWMQDVTAPITTIIGQAAATTATTMAVWYQTVGALAVEYVTPTTPFTWATGDILQMSLTYEAA